LRSARYRTVADILEHGREALLLPTAEPA